MAKVKRGTEATKESKVAPVKPEPKKKESVAAAKKVESPKGPAVSFVKWFKSKGYKPHWRLGMEAFADTSGRRTAEEWEKLFKAY